MPTEPSEQVVVFLRVTYNGLSLYMLLILLRWFGPWIEVDTRSTVLRWISRLTDPLIHLMRRVLPHMGPMDFGPLAALAAVWFARTLMHVTALRMAS